MSIYFQDRGIDFGLEVMPCSDPPGVKIFGYAPQFNAKNFSHIFVHGNDYEIPGKSLILILVFLGPLDEFFLCNLRYS